MLNYFTLSQPLAYNLCAPEDETNYLRASSPLLFGYVPLDLIDAKNSE